MDQNTPLIVSTGIAAFLFGFLLALFIAAYAGADDLKFQRCVLENDANARDCAFSSGIRK